MAKMSIPDVKRIIDYVDIAYANGSPRLMSSGNMARSHRALVGIAHRELSRISGVSLRTIQRWSRGEVANPKNGDQLLESLNQLEPRVKADYMNAADLLDKKKGKAYQTMVDRMKTDYKYARKRLDGARAKWQRRIKEGDSGASNPWSGVMSS